MHFRYINRFSTPKFSASDRVKRQKKKSRFYANVKNPALDIKRSSPYHSGWVVLTIRVILITNTATGTSASSRAENDLSRYIRFLLLLSLSTLGVGARERIVCPFNWYRCEIKEEAWENFVLFQAPL